MIRVRQAAERGHTQIGWLDSWHTFSFNTYYDPKHSGYGSLRVINDDRVTAGNGFGTHGHRDMEILTWVLSGALEHRDSTGGGGILRPGDLQMMSAGTGIRHSEFNASETEPVHFLQVWIFPDEQGHEPRYDQKTFDGFNGSWKVVASPDGEDGSLPIHQDAKMLVARFEGEKKIDRALDPKRKYWLQVGLGEVTANGQTLKQGDGAAIEGESALAVSSDGKAEVVLFDLAG